MAINLSKYIPYSVRNRNRQLKLFIDALSEVMERHRLTLRELEAKLDVETTPAPFLDLILKDKSWGCKAELTETQKRKLIPFVHHIHANRGTVEIIIFTIKLLFGVNLILRKVPDVDRWEYGFDQYGFQTVYIANSKSVNRLNFATTKPLTQMELKAVLQIIDYLRCYGVEYILAQNGSNVDPKSKAIWQYGFSQYGFETANFS